MNDKINDVDLPPVPTPSSLYGSEDDLQAYETDIQEIMQKHQVSRPTAEQIYHSGYYDEE